MNAKLLLSAAWLALSFSSAQAAGLSSGQNSTGFSIKPVLGFGLTSGGDNIVKAKFDDGSSESLKAGGFFLLYGGADFRFAGPFSVRTTIGYHRDSINASNASFSFSRIPIEATGSYALHEQFRLGGGLQLAMNGKASGSIDNTGSGSQKYKMAPGFIINGEFMSTPNFGIEARYVVQDYKPKDGSEKLSGNHFGILLTGYF